MRGQSTEGRLLIFPHEAAIAEDIGTEYGGELTFQYPPIASRLSCRVLMDVKACFKWHTAKRLWRVRASNFRLRSGTRLKAWRHARLAPICVWYSRHPPRSRMRRLAYSSHMARWGVQSRKPSETILAGEREKSCDWRHGSR